MNENYETGYVYFVQAGEDQAVKIGNTILALQDRMFALQTANHRKLKLIGAIDIRVESGKENLNRTEYSKLAKSREAEIHQIFANSLIGGEWYSIDHTLTDYIKTTSNIDVSKYI